jgi:hypothetical protein
LTTFYGTALVFYNSYLPIIVSDHPSLKKFMADKNVASDSVEVVREREQLSSAMSTRGLGLGYSGGVLCLAVSFAVLKHTEGSLQR